MFRTLLVLGLVTFVGCGDDSTADTAPPDTALRDTATDPARDTPPSDTASDSPADTPEDVVVEDGVLVGRVLYEDRPFDRTGFTGETPMRPARRVPVTLLDGRGVVRGDATTDDDGRFRIEHGRDAGESMRLRVLARASMGGHTAQVIDRASGPQVYSLDAEVVLGGSPVVLEATIESGLGGPFNVVDVAVDAFTVYAPFVGEAAPSLSYRWEAGRPFDCGSCYGDNVVSLGGGLDDTDEYDDDIIVHELGHYFVDHYSRDSSPGGSHRDRQVTPVLAYGEGIGYFFSTLVSGRPYIVDTFASSVRVIDYEALTQNGATRPDFLGTTNGRLDGDLREEIVAGIFVDAFDEASGAEPFDRVALGTDAMMSLLVDHFGSWPHRDQGVRGIDLADLLYALVCVSEVPAADVQALADDRGFPWSADTVGDCRL